jgi:hypothetical protein
MVLPLLQIPAVGLRRALRGAVRVVAEVALVGSAGWVSRARLPGVEPSREEGW